MPTVERFQNVDTGSSLALRDTLNSDVQAAGTNHAKGLVPDPGSSTHSPAWLFGDDATFHSFIGGLIGSIAVQVFISGGGGVIASGSLCVTQCPFGGTITSWSVVADQSGSIVVDILRANQATPSSSIVGAGNKPTLSSQSFATAAPSSWTSTTIAAGDVLTFSVSGSPSSVTWANIALTCTRTS